MATSTGVIAWSITSAETDPRSIDSIVPAKDRLPILHLTLQEAAAGVKDGTFAQGSMGPKVTAAAAFVRRTGRFAAIGALEDAVAVLEGRAGTRLVNESLVAA